MALFWFKLLITPVLLTALTLIARRHGPRVAGVLTGLPLTSGPVSAFLAREHGGAFAAHAALGALRGVMLVGLFAGTYAIVARRTSWRGALLAGIAALAAGNAYAAAVAPGSVAGVATTTLAVLATLWLAITRTEPRHDGLVAPPRPPPRWDLVARVVVSTTLVMLVTAFADRLGPGQSGALSTLPVFTAVLAVFTHRHSGARAASQLLTGAIGGSISAVAFFIVIGSGLDAGPVLPIYAAAVAVALAVGAGWAAYNLRSGGTTAVAGAAIGGAVRRRGRGQKSVPIHSATER